MRSRLKLAHLLDQMEVLEQDGPVGEPILLARHRDTGVGRRPRPAVVVLGYQHSSLGALVAREFTLQNELGLASLTGANYLQG
jgi:hypothetical protein